MITAQMSLPFWPTATRFIADMRGGSQAKLLHCNDGVYRVCKMLKNPQSDRVLANELVSSRLGRLVGVPVAAGAVIDVTASIALELTYKDMPGGPAPCPTGPAFGSDYPGDPAKTSVYDWIPDGVIEQLGNIREFCAALVFDKWLCNTDGRQTVFTRSGPQYLMTAIDNGFCFNGGEWNFPDAPLRGLYLRRIVYQHVTGWDDFEPWLSNVENIQPDAVARCFAGIPESWLGDAASQFQGLIERTYNRRRLVREQIQQARRTSVAPFPNWVN